MGKESAYSAGDQGSIPGSERSPGEGNGNPLFFFFQAVLPGKPHRRRSLIGYSPWGRKESDTTERLHFPCRATQDGWVMMESSDKMWSAGEGSGKPLQYSCLENPMNSMKRQKDRTLKDELPGSVDAQYATGDELRNDSRKNEGMEPKKKQHPVVDVIGDGTKVQYCKEQYCIGTWNARSMNQGKLEVVK